MKLGQSGGTGSLRHPARWPEASLCPLSTNDADGNMVGNSDRRGERLRKGADAEIGVRHRLPARWSPDMKSTCEPLGRYSSFGIVAPMISAWRVSARRRCRAHADAAPRFRSRIMSAASSTTSAGNRIGALDGEGYLTRTVYDAAGRKVQDIAYATWPVCS